MKLLTGHTSQDTAYLIEDYPYGRSLRCQRKVWVETKKNQGQRFVSQTSNPKQGNNWNNKPHAGTYSAVIVLYIDESTGYVEAKGFSEYVSWQELQNFKDWLGEDGLRQLDEYQFNRFSSLYSAYKADNEIKTKYDVQYTSELKSREDWANIKVERFELFKQNLAELNKSYNKYLVAVESSDAGNQIFRFPTEENQKQFTDKLDSEGCKWLKTVEDMVKV